VWLYEGSLEQFAGGGRHFDYRQRMAWPEEPSWEQVLEFGLWTVERLSINGHLLVGLRARPESAAPGAARLISPITSDGTS
jgi:hypothetical protein